jgi:hypothetical protein
LTRARIDWVWERSDTVYYFTDDTNVASMRMHAGFGAQRRTMNASCCFAPLDPPRP